MFESLATQPQQDSHFDRCLLRLSVSLRGRRRRGGEGKNRGRFDPFPPFLRPVTQAS